jgi:hypothetical protein
LPAGGEEYQVHADGDLQCIVPEDASAGTPAQPGRRIQVRLADGKTNWRKKTTTVLGMEKPRCLFRRRSILFCELEEDWVEMDDVQSTRATLQRVFDEFMASRYRSMAFRSKRRWKS